MQKNDVSAVRHNAAKIFFTKSDQISSNLLFKHYKNSISKHI